MVGWWRSIVGILAVRYICAFAYAHHASHSATMAKSRFEYVKNYELPDALMPNTFIVVRVDGRGFHK